MKPSLAALLDGAPLPDPEAKALWLRFSAHMDEHEGDSAGFARQCDWHSVSPEYRKGQAVLVVCSVPGAPTRAPKSPGSARGGSKPKAKPSASKPKPRSRG